MIAWIKGLFRPRSKALVSADGSFICTPEHAVEIAHMISTAEGYISTFRPDDDYYSRGDRAIAAMEIVGEYLEGNKSVERVMRDLKEAIEELDEKAAVET